MRAWPFAIALPLLAGCVEDSATLQLAGPEHALTVQLRQPYFWRKTVDVEVLMSRQPDCLRRSRLDPMALAEVGVEVWRPDEGEFAEPILLLKQGAQYHAVSTKTCEMQRFRTPPQKPGARVGTFRLEGERLKFAAAPVSRPAAAPLNPPPAAPPQ